MKVEAFVIDEPTPVSLGDFADEAGALAAVHAAQARGIVTRTGAGFVLIPAARVVRYVVGPASVAEARPAKRR